MILVEEIESGCFFRKQSGRYAYMRMSDSSAEFIGLDRSFIYGVSFNGSVTRVKRGTVVVSVAVDEFIANIKADAAWHELIGVRS